MIKNKFFRYYRLILPCLIGYLLMDVMVIVVFMHRLSNGITRDELSFWLLFFLVLNLHPYVICFYWVFQIVLIDEDGIKVLFFKKTIIDCRWSEIKRVEKSYGLRSNSLLIYMLNGKKFLINDGKAIVKAIKYYSNDTIKIQPGRFEVDPF